MVLQEFIEIKICLNKQKQFYEKLGYKAELGETILVKNEDVNSNSRVIEQRKCDNPDCLKVIERSHRSWVDTFNAFGKDLCQNCARKEQHKKAKETNLKKYGVEYPMQSKEIKEKAKKTTYEHYGCEYSFQNEKVRKKAEEMSIEKYGSLSNQAIIAEEKRKMTNLEKYGHENTFQVKEFKEKAEQTNFINYGVNNVSQSEEIKQKKIDTMNEHFDVDYALQNKEIFQKMKDTIFERFGKEWAMQNDEVKERAINTLYLNGKIPTSSQQLQVYEMIKQLYPDSKVTLNCPLSKISLDIELVIDNIKIDVEYDGCYWHKDQNYDRRRDEFCKGMGYKILRIRSNKKIPTQEQLKEAISYLVNEDNAFAFIKLEDWEE